MLPSYQEYSKQLSLIQQEYEHLKSSSITPYLNETTGSEHYLFIQVVGSYRRQIRISSESQIASTIKFAIKAHKDYLLGTTSAKRNRQNEDFFLIQKFHSLDCMEEYKILPDSPTFEGMVIVLEAVANELRKKMEFHDEAVSKLNRLMKKMTKLEAELDKTICKAMTLN